MKLFKFLFIFVFIFIPINNLFAYYSFIESLQKGNINGEFKIWYQTNDKEPHDIFYKENSILDTGVNLSYESKKWYSSFLKLSFFAVDDIGLYNKIADKSCIRQDPDQTTTWLGEAYIGYEFENTSFIIGRQNFKSPLLNSDGWSIFPNNFEGILLKNKDIPKTNFVLGWFFKERHLKQEKFNDLLGDDGVIVVGIKTKIIPKTSISGYYYKSDLSGRDYFWQGKNYIGYVNGFYTDVKTGLNLYEDIGFEIAAQYLRIDPDRNEFDATDGYGLKVGVSFLKKMAISFAYSSVGNGYFNLAKFSDNGIKTPLYTATISGDGDVAGRPNTDSFKISATATPIKKLAITINYGIYRCDDKWNTSVSNNDTVTSQEIVLKYGGFKHFVIFGAFVHSDHHGVGAWKGSGDDALNSIRFWMKFYF